MCTGCLQLWHTLSKSWVNFSLDVDTRHNAIADSSCCKTWGRGGVTFDCRTQLNTVTFQSHKFQTTCLLLLSVTKRLEKLWAGNIPTHHIKQKTHNIQLKCFKTLAHAILSLKESERLFLALPDPYTFVLSSDFSHQIIQDGGSLDWTSQAEDATQKNCQERLLT